MADLAGLFRDEMLRSRANRLAGSVVAEGGAGTWLAICSCLASILLLLAWISNATYSSGRYATGVISEVGRRGSDARLGIILPLSTLSYLHEGSRMEMTSGSRAAGGIVTKLSIDRDDGSLDGRILNRQVIRIELTLERGSQTIGLLPGSRVGTKTVVETRTILRWIVGR